MAKPRRTKKDLKRKSEELALTERRFALGREVGREICFFVLTMATTVSVLHGAPWPVPGSTAILASLSALSSRRRR
jgi:hypothetical protein